MMADATITAGLEALTIVVIAARFAVASHFFT
jgi:hypothetical protein